MSIIKYYNKADAEKAVNSSKIPFGNKVFFLFYYFQNIVVSFSKDPEEKPNYEAKEA